MPVKKRIIFLHITGCTSFLLLPFLFFPHPSQSFASISDPATQRDVIGQVLLIGFFYFNYFVLIRKYYFKRKWTAFFSMILLCFVAVILLPSIFTGHFNLDGSQEDSQSRFHSERQPPPLRGKQAIDEPPARPPPDFQDSYAPPQQAQQTYVSSFFEEVGHHIFLFLVVLFFSLNLSINDRWKQVQQEKSDAELSYLKAQINPHFLFNILNTIYSLTIQKADSAPEAVVKLAGMMRYVLHEANKELVSLEKELNYIRDYIALQMLRFGSAVQLFFEIRGETTGKRITPLLLIPFVENAFKHGVNAEEEASIHIEITIVENAFYLRIRNDKVHAQQLPEDKSGIGLYNVRSRLQLLYAGNYILEIDDLEKEFLVMLQLQLI